MEYYSPVKATKLELFIYTWINLTKIIMTKLLAESYNYGIIYIRFLNNANHTMCFIHL